MTRSPWPAERRFRRDEAASSGTVVDDKYGGANWCRHLIDLKIVVHLIFNVK